MIFQEIFSPLQKWPQKNVLFCAKVIRVFTRFPMEFYYGTVSGCGNNQFVVFRFGLNFV